ncbi:MAG TPA: hypothetical protein VM733_00950 [Thermoanaerobaculia bacterium]|nr:hypothetical protein [Thermoanaerobaculia bacterium]
MRKLAAVSLLFVALASYAAPATIAGSYAGPDPSYGLILEVAADGSLRGNYVESGHVAVLNAIEVSGTSFRARASFDDGSLRVLNGAVEARGIRIGDRFFEKI